jgi:hypothetical protein
LDKLYQRSISMGCDPEFFLSTKDGKIVESSVLIPDNGIKSNKGHQTCVTNDGLSTKLTRDGVQVEINCRPNTCRANLGNEIMHIFGQLYEKLNNEQANLKACFDEVVKLDVDIMAKLDNTSKVFGCAPSKNLYSGKTSIITVDASKYPYRSGGGHIHIGGAVGNRVEVREFLHKQTKLAVRLLDIVCGNTCVLIDRDPGQIERRKVYGRAGEYRLPEYGLEYRTPSNFWLRSYELFSLTFGLARLAIEIGLTIYAYEKANKKRHPYRILLRLCTKKNIEIAINNNDFDLAKKNFDKIKHILCKMTGYSGHYPIADDNLADFEYFVEKGIDHWFKEDPLMHWKNHPEGHETGWESWCNRTVKPQRLVSEGKGINPLEAKEYPLDEEDYDDNEYDRFQ